jgi:hypothetical protein
VTFTKRQADAARQLAALPDDAWSLEDWHVFYAARDVLAEEVERFDRARARDRASGDRERQTAKRRVQGNPIPQVSREAVRGRSGGACEASTPACPAGRHRAEHVHHLAGRSNHNPDNLLHVCHLAHQHIHANPAESYAAGWMRKRLGAVVDGGGSWEDVGTEIDGPGAASTAPDPASPTKES